VSAARPQAYAGERESQYLPPRTPYFVDPSRPCTCSAGLATHWGFSADSVKSGRVRNFRASHIGSRENIPKVRPACGYLNRITGERGARRASTCGRTPGKALRAAPGCKPAGAGPGGNRFWEVGRSTLWLGVSATGYISVPECSRKTRCLAMVTRAVYRRPGGCRTGAWDRGRVGRRQQAHHQRGPSLQLRKLRDGGLFRIKASGVLSSQSPSHPHDRVPRLRDRLSSISLPPETRPHQLAARTRFPPFAHPRVPRLQHPRIGIMLHAAGRLLVKELRSHPCLAQRPAYGGTTLQVGAIAAGRADVDGSSRPREVALSGSRDTVSTSATRKASTQSML